MSDSIRYEIESDTISPALLALPSAAQAAVNRAAEQSARSIQREAHARLKRQLGPNATGATLEGLTVRPAFDRNGWIVLSEREHVSISLHTMSRSGRMHTQAVTQSNVPLWLEKGTKRGRGTHANPARPYFYVSALLEEGAHLRRVEAALQETFDSAGLGG